MNVDRKKTVHKEVPLSELQNNVYKKSLIKDKCYIFVEKINTDI